MTNQTSRSLKIVHAIHNFMTAKEAHEAKPYHQSRDDRTYHVACYGQQRFMLAYIIDAEGQEVTELQPTDKVDYYA